MYIVRSCGGERTECVQGEFRVGVIAKSIKRRLLTENVDNFSYNLLHIISMHSSCLTSLLRTQIRRHNECIVNVCLALSTQLITNEGSHTDKLKYLVFL
jgi:hypothetical protein